MSEHKINKINVKGENLRGWGRNGYINVDHVEVYTSPDGAFTGTDGEPSSSVHIRSAKSRQGSPIIVKGPRDKVLALFERVRDAIQLALPTREKFLDTDVEVDTIDAYAESGGDRCPVCGENDRELEGFRADGNLVLQDVECNSCGAAWVDVFRVVRYSELEVPGRSMR